MYINAKLYLVELALLVINKLDVVYGDVVYFLYISIKNLSKYQWLILLLCHGNSKEWLESQGSLRKKTQVCVQKEYVII